ncbi:MAG: hypothetical protein LBL08_01630 [Candidatus Nomurabacteria bacterium]|jgi:hypothetical protein|nr:hypothetical protein [Candidatus Nomurabacteria bacterium]
MKKVINDDTEVFVGEWCSDRPRRFGVWRVFWGLLFLVAAATIVLSLLDVFTLSGISNIGWLVLAIFLAALTIASLFRLKWFGLFLPLAGIATIANYQTEYLSVSDSTIGAIWAVAGLAAIGFSILFHRRRYWHHRRKNRPSPRHNKTTEDSDISIDVNFGSAIKYVESDDFRHARIDCNFSSVKIYFDNASIKGDKATIDLLDASFSGLELYIPSAWRIVNNVHCSLAGIEEKNQRRRFDPKDEKIVELTGELNLSGVEIIYV